MKSAYYLLSKHERRRRYNAEHDLPEPPLPDEEVAERPLGALDGLGDLAWIAPMTIVVLAVLVALLAIFEPHWLK